VFQQISITQIQFNMLAAFAEPTPQTPPDPSAPRGVTLLQRILHNFPALPQPVAQDILVLVHAPIFFSHNPELKQRCTSRLASPAFDLLFTRASGSVADVASLRSDFEDVLRRREAAILEQHCPPSLQLASLLALVMLLTSNYSNFVVPLPLMPPLCSEWSLVEDVAARLRPAGDESGAAVGTWETLVGVASLLACPFEDPVLQDSLKDLTSSYIVTNTSRESPQSPILPYMAPLLPLAGAHDAHCFHMDQKGEVLRNRIPRCFFSLSHVCGNFSDC
jgi:hypothetical protein